MNQPKDKVLSALLRAIGYAFFVLAGVNLANDQGFMAFLGAMCCGHLFVSISSINFFIKTDP